MSLANILNIPVSEKDFSNFSFNNSDLHQRINNKIGLIYNEIIPNFILDPIGDFQSWLYRHQQVHNFQNQILGISGNDLTAVDPKNKGQISSWIRLHFNEHLQASDLLGM